MILQLFVWLYCLIYGTWNIGTQVLLPVNDLINPSLITVPISTFFFFEITYRFFMSLSICILCYIISMPVLNLVNGSKSVPARWLPFLLKSYTSIFQGQPNHKQTWQNWTLVIEILYTGTEKVTIEILCPHM